MQYITKNIALSKAVSFPNFLLFALQIKESMLMQLNPSRNLKCSNKTYNHVLSQLTSHLTFPT